MNVWKKKKRKWEKQRGTCIDRRINREIKDFILFVVIFPNEDSRLTRDDASVSQLGPFQSLYLT